MSATEDAIDASRTYAEHICAGRLPQGRPPQVAVGAETMVSRTRNASASDLEQPDWKLMAEAFINLTEQVGPELRDPLREAAGRCYYYAEAFEDAIEVLSEADLFDSDVLRLARARFEGYPEGFRHLENLSENRDQRILETWREELERRSVDGLTELRDHFPDVSAWAEYVGPALTSSGRHEDAFYLYGGAGDFESMSSSLAQLLPGRSAETQKDLLKWAADQLIERQRWNDLIELVGRRSPGKHIKGESARATRQHVIERMAYTRPVEVSIGEEGQKDYVGWIQDESDETNSRLSYRELGAALEKVGHHKSAQDYYLPEATSKTDSERRTFARERWLAATQRRIAWTRRASGVSSRRIGELEKEREAMLHGWSMGTADLKRISDYFEPDTSAGAEEEVATPRDSSSAEGRIGQPGTPVTENEATGTSEESETRVPDLPAEEAAANQAVERDLAFSIRVNRSDSRRQVVVTYGQFGDGVDIDVENGIIKASGSNEVKTETREGENGELVSFEIDEAGAKICGALQLGDDMRCLELDVEGLPDPMVLRL